MKNENLREAMEEAWEDLDDRISLALICSSEKDNETFKLFFKLGMIEGIKLIRGKKVNLDD